VRLQPLGRTALEPVSTISDVTNFYVWLKFLHLLGVGVFLMGHGVSAGTSLALRGRPLDSLSRALLQLSIRSQAIAYPGLFLIVATGVWMGFLGSWWRTGWIWTAIAVLVVAFIAMSAMSVPYHRARAEKSDSSTAADTPLARSRPLPLLAIGVLGLLVLFFLMVFKPF
jgi:hypothetical protein